MDMQIHFLDDAEFSTAPTLEKPNSDLLGAPPLEKLEKKADKIEEIPQWLLAVVCTGFSLFFLIVEQVVWPLLFAILIALPIFQNFLQKKQAGFIRAYQFSPIITERLSREYPHLSDQQLSSVIEGLKQYFILCHAAGGKMVAMPSKAVDIAWHEFILLTRAYEDFCRNGMGRFLHYTPIGIMSQHSIGAVTTEARRQAWLLACEWERINVRAPSRLPFLFAIDTAFEIPGGFKHSLDNNYADEAPVIKRRVHEGDYCSNGCHSPCNAD